MLPDLKLHADGQQLPGTTGIWTFLFMDMIVFFAIFVVFASERARVPAIFEESQRHLNGWIGLANTLILLTSSWMMVRSVQAVREGAIQSAKLRMGGVLAFGALFVLSKSVEYYFKYASGIGFAANSFFSFYYFMTIVHLIHVLGGMAFIWSIRGSLENGEKAVGLRHVENVGLFWHLVDVLWIYIFSIVYLLGMRP